MKFGKTLKLLNTELIVSNRYDRWMEANSNPEYSAEALAFAAGQLAAKPRNREGSFSASSVESCKRRQQFTFLGMPEMAPSSKTSAIFHNGSFMHLRWQMAGITEGWLKEAEVKVPENDLWLKGTMDGVLYEDSIVEFKSINTNGFGRVSAFGPTESHLSQGATYALASGREKVSFIYEDKNTQEYKEFVKHRDELPLAEVEAKAIELWESVEAEELYEPLNTCIDKTGYQYTGCPFRDRCLKIKDWEEAARAD